MRKALIVILSAALIFAVCGCKKDSFTDEKISQLRTDIYAFESDSFNLFCYCEKRENPFKEDGNVGERQTFAIFKIVPTGEDLSEKEILVKYAAEKFTVCGKFEYKPLSDARYAYLAVPVLPDENFTAELTIDGKSVTAEMKSLKRSDLKDYKIAIDAVKAADEKNLKKFFGDREYGEIRIRLLESGGDNYWYVGFISENEKREYLLDGVTAEIIDIRA